jgi:hypothetical protein
MALIEEGRCEQRTILASQLSTRHLVMGHTECINIDDERG